MTSIHWKSGVSGTWSVASDWSTGEVPTASDTVSIAAPPLMGPYTIDFDTSAAVGALVLDQAAATLAINDAKLTIGTDLFLEAGTLDLDAGSLSGGTIVSSGGTMASDNSVLSGIAVKGKLLLAEGNFVVDGALTILPDSEVVLKSSLYFAGTQSMLGGGTILLEGGELAAYADGFSGNGTLVLGSQVHMDVSGIGYLAAGAIKNDGDISISGSNSVFAEYQYVTFTNAGTINVGTGSELNFLSSPGNKEQQGPIGFTNTGLITVASGGLFALKIDSLYSNTGTIKVAGTLELGGSYTTAQALSLGLSAESSLDVVGPMDNAGDTLTVGSGGELRALDLSASIVGGTIVNYGGFTAGSGSALSDLVFDGPLTVSNHTSLSLDGGITLHGTDGSGQGTIILDSSYYDGLEISGSQTLSGIVIDTVSPNPSTPQTYTIDFHDPYSDTPSTLTLAGTTNLATNELIFHGSTVDGKATGDTILNVGDLTLGASLRFLNLINKGSTSIAGTNVSFTYGELTNDGTITVDAGDEFKILTGYVNTSGTIAVDAGTLLLDVDVTTAGLGKIQLSAGAEIAFDGTITNTGNTLALGAGNIFSNANLVGEIIGGTISAAASGILFSPATSAGIPPVLSDVVYDGPLLLTQAGAALSIENGFVLHSANGSPGGSIALTGSGSRLFFDTETLQNTSIAIGAEGVSTEFAAASLSTLTLANGVTVNQVGVDATLGGGGGELLNAGTISDAVSDSTLTLEGTFDNTGMISVSNGATLMLVGATLTNSGTFAVSNGSVEIEGDNLSDLSGFSFDNATLDIAGYLYASGETLTVGMGSGIAQAQISGIMEGGTIHDAGNGLRFLGNNVILDTVTYQGVMTVSQPFTTVYVENGFTAEGLNGSSPGTIDLTGYSSTLVTTDTTPLDNATIEIGNASVASTLSSNSPYTSGPGTLNLGSGLTINQIGAHAVVGVVGDTVDSLASIDAGLDGGNLITAAMAFSSAGGITASDGGTFTTAAVNFVNAGTITVAGSNSAFSIDPTAYFQAATFAANCFENTGAIDLNGGALTQETEGGGYPEVPVLNAGTILGNGSIAVALTNNGTIAATGGILTISEGISGRGLLEADASSTLLLTGGVSAGVTAYFAGGSAELGLALQNFLGVIGGFASGDTIDLLNEAASAAHFAGDSILVTLTAGGTITLETRTALSGSLTVTSDGNGGSLIAFAGHG